MKCSAILLILPILSCNRANDKILTERIPPDIFSRLPVYRSTRAPVKSTNRYLLVTYFNDLDCRTCVTRELANIKRLSFRHKDDLDFALVTYAPEFESMRDRHPYLDDLIRTNEIGYPVHVESIRGEAGFGDPFRVMLVDRATGMIMLQYLPNPDVEEWPRFESLIEKIMATQTQIPWAADQDKERG